MYETGLGVKADKYEAIRWYFKAAEQGHKEAKARLLKNF
jgi:TPR repeat protein